MSGATQSQDTFFFSCSACGKCCNSPPALTVPELFHHEAHFFGCLALRRVARIREGTRVASRLGPRPADAHDARESAALAERVLHPLPNGADWLSLAGQAFGYASENRCPALDTAGRCDVHTNRKPLTCFVVPLDSLLPDRLQGAVLSTRAREAAYLGADCVRTVARYDAPPFVAQEHIDDDARRALNTHRDALADEKRYWANRVFAELGRDPSFAWHALPETGFYALSLAPALLVLAEVSEPCRLRVLSYLEAQERLGERMIERALTRRSLTDRPVTGQLRTLLRTNATLRAALGRSKVLHSAGRSRDEVNEIERWLGLHAA